jgi:hypothetical protein
MTLFRHVYVWCGPHPACGTQLGARRVRVVLCRWRVKMAWSPQWTIARKAVAREARARSCVHERCREGVKVN